MKVYTKLRNSIGLLFCLGFSSLSMSVMAQGEVEEYLQAEYCDSVQNRSIRLISEQVKQPNLQVAAEALAAWERECGLTESVCLGYTALDLLEGYYANGPVPDDVINCLLDYRLYCADTLYYSNKSTSKFDQFLKSAAQQFNTKDAQPDETFLKLYLEGDLDILAIAKLLPSAKLSQQANAMADSIANLPETQWGVQLGSYIPTGKNKLFGFHPVLGLTFCRRFRGLKIGLDGDYKIGNSAKEYTVRYNDTETTVKRMNAFYFGIHFQKQLLGKRNHFLWGRAGAGFDMLVPIPSKDTNGDGEIDVNGLSLTGANINLGLAYEYHRINKSSFIFSAVYSSSQLMNTGGTAIDGNYFNIGIGLRYALNSEKQLTWRSLHL